MQMLKILQWDITHISLLWKSSPGHYRNLIDEEHRAGAIACYKQSGKTYWVAIFGGVDLDKEIKK